MCWPLEHLSPCPCPRAPPARVARTRSFVLAIIRVSIFVFVRFSHHVALRSVILPDSMLVQPTDGSHKRAMEDAETKTPHQRLYAMHKKKQEKLRQLALESQQKQNEKVRFVAYAPHVPYPLPPFLASFLSSIFTSCPSHPPASPMFVAVH